ncbi:glycosyltransferase family 2 protein [Blautia sp. HCP3S3_H10_1]|uniref:glycosyltransferase family 2 protein n=1 Tax=unclassified Blautia TaxID=2648079 RepID=UPI003F8EAC47
MNELVSIIMPSYNTAKYIALAIQSIIEQTYQNWELIIVDDYSTDSTDLIVESIHDSRIKYIKNEKNLGAAACRNKAIRHAKGRWIAFLDSDDKWKPEKLEKQIKFMLQKKCFFSYTNYEEIDLEDNITNVIVTGPEVISKNGMFNYCWPGCLTVMYDQNRIGTIQIANIKKNNDYAMWLQICKKEKCYLLNEVLGEYRRGRKGSISSHSYFELIKWHYLLFRTAEKESVFFSFLNTIRNMIFGVYKKKRYVLKNEKR